MKKLYTFCSVILTALFYCNPLQAQVSSYTMSDAEVAYSSQSGLTDLATGTGTGGTMDNNIFTAVPIGFTFVFNCQSYTTVGVSTNGFLWFGTTNPSTTEFTPISSSTAMDGVVAAYALDAIGGGNSGGEGTPRLSYGNPSSGVFMVEWNGLKRQGAGISNNNNRFDLQIKLIQTTNVVIIRVNDYEYGYIQSYTGQVGLRGSSNADFNNIGVNCNSTTWGAPSTTTNANTATAKMNPCYPGNFGTCQQFTYTPTINCCVPPTVTANTSANSVCAGSPVTLTGGGTAATYTWNNGVLNGVAFNPAGTATYTVTGDDGAGCTATATVTVGVNPLPTVVANSTATSVCAGSTITLTGSGASTYIWNNGATNGVPFTVASSITFNVTGTDANGCMNTDFINITVNAPPTIVANTTANAVCSGGTITLTGSGATNYSWNNGVLNGIPFVPASSATYVVIGDNGTSCSATASVSVTVNSLPTVVANVSEDTVCNGGSVTFTGSGASTYSWDNAVTDGVPFVITAPGTFNVTGTDGNGCSNTASVNVYTGQGPTVNANASATTICFRDTVVLFGSGNAGSYSWDSGVIDGDSFGPLATHTYTVTATGTGGCTGSDTITVNVNMLPDVYAFASDTIVCAGSAVIFTASGAISYVWDNNVVNGIPYTVDTTAAFTVMGTDGNSCTNSAQVTVVVNPLPLLTIDFAAIDTLCTSNGVVNLTGESPTGGLYTGAGVFGNTFNPAQTFPGLNTITYSYGDINGCSNSISGNIWVDVCSGIKEDTSSPAVILFPNPSSGLFTIIIDTPSRISIYNVLNQVILDKEFTVTDNTIDITAYANGLYFLKVLNGNKETGLKMIKN